MSVIYKSEEISIICHQCFLNYSYKTLINDKETLSLTCKADFFSITNPYKLFHKRRKLQVIECPKISNILNKFKAARALIEENIVCSHYNISEVCDAKETAEEFYEQSAKRCLQNLDGGNNLTYNVIANIGKEDYVIPMNSRFYNYDISRMKALLDAEDSYDLIVIDPPWWNKFIRRRKDKKHDSYKMMWNSDLSQLPISTILRNDGLVCTWCTNSESHFQTLTDEIFPMWGLKYVATWYWLKVTVKGEPVTPFSPANGKQPYERIIFGVKAPSGSLPLPEDKKLLVSVPSSIHSHKPPLCDIVKPYVSANPKCLEIFARYLLPNWTSYGNEVLKLQHLSLFKQIQ